MKRSEAIKKLIPKVVSKFEVIYKENYDNGVYEARAEELLNFIEKELGMVPPEIKEWVEISPYNILGAGFKVSYNRHKWEEE